MHVVASTKQTLTLISLVLSLAVGGFTFSYFHHIQQRQNQLYLKQVKALNSLTKVVVLRKTLPPGAILSRQDLAVKTVPKAFVNANNVRAIEKVAGAKVKATVYSGEPLNKLRLSSGSHKVASQLIKKGNVALAIPADAVLGLAGGVNPFDRIDIFFTEQETGNTKLLYSNVLVIGVSGKEPFNKLTFSQEPVIIIQVNQGEAEKIVAAIYKGKLHFALRSSQ